jgi:hypothetical protein
MERMMGIEPTYAAWKAAFLPLNYIRTLAASRSRVRSDRRFAHPCEDAREG